MNNKIPQFYTALCVMVFLWFTGNAQITYDKTVEDIISKMSINEKVDFIGGYNDFNIRGYSQYGIPEIHTADGPVGIRNYGKSTAYPANINLAASWDTQIAYNIGKAIALEARTKNVHIVLGPGINIYRMPVAGRNFEYLGEDPYLAGEIATEYINGMQAQGVMACAKHFVANNQEFDRNNCSSDMDERTLHEIYLPAFKKVVMNAHVATIMTSYNPVNGIHASENSYLNNSILKKDWAFNGFVMSDWVSTYNGLNCAKAGLDLEMPSGKMMNKTTLIPAIKNGDITEEIINDKVRRILTVYQRFGLLENADLSKNFVLDRNFVRTVAIDAARGGMVLLKNEADILPLNKSSIKTIAIIGPNAQTTISGGGGSSYVDPNFQISLSDAIHKLAGNTIEIITEKGIYTGASFPEKMFDNFDFYTYEHGKKVEGVTANYYVGKKIDGNIIFSTRYEKLHLIDSDFWKNNTVPTENFSVRFSCFYSPKETGHYSIGVLGDDGYILKLNGKKIIDKWKDQAPTRSKADVFLHKGKEYAIELEYYQSAGGAQIMLGAIKVDVETKPKVFEQRAIEAAKKADVVIMAVGFNSDFEGESFDRTYEMPYNQSKFINTIAKANNNIIVVVNSGGNVEMQSWIHNSKALLMAWYPGQEGNIAAAEILFGITNPSGKLPASFEKNLHDNPCYPHYFDNNKDSRVFYGEGIFMGYRHWDKSALKPRFAFGYGLSYTTFTVLNITTNKKEYTQRDTVKITVTITNTGNINGSEVIQLYVKDTECSVPRPIKELKAFEKINLTKGEQKTIEFTLTQDAFSFYNATTHNWEVEAGEFEICIGNSSDNILQTAKIIIQ